MQKFKHPTILEVGCGVGNSMIPLLEDFPHLRVWGVDFAPRAIELVKVKGVGSLEEDDGMLIRCLTTTEAA